MKTFIIIGLAAAALVLTSCEDGPSGPQPTQELYTLYDAPPVTGIKVELSGRMIIHGPIITMTSVPMLHDTAFGNEIHISTTPVGGTPTVRIKFKTIPTAPGTFAFTAATISNAAGTFAPMSDQGAFVSYAGNLYAPLSGSITITNVEKDDSFIYGYSGYVNGRLQAMWPRDFKPTASQPFPPGFTLANLVLVGEILTLQSAVFKTRAKIAIRTATN